MLHKDYTLKSRKKNLSFVHAPYLAFLELQYNKMFYM